MDTVKDTATTATVGWQEALRDADRALRTNANPLDSSLWGVLDGQLVRLRGIGVCETVPASDILASLAIQERRPAEKSLTDRAFELMFHWIACQTRPSTLREDDEELPREAVRFCRALESEVAKPTERPKEQPRAARRAREDEEERW